MNDKRILIPIIEDDEFLRDKVPMTKSAVRHLSIARLKLTKDAVLYDVGSGTGSIAIEAAYLDDSIKVYAIEKKEEALNLIEANKEKFGRDNVHVIGGNAPESFQGLETPTHAFIGGSSGNLESIIEELRNKNPKTRIVINAISLETISEITKLIREISTEDLVIEQVMVSRSNEVGNYHLMKSENPVTIVSFNLV